MFVYLFTVNGSQVLAKLDVRSANEFKPIDFEGDRDAVESVKDWLEGAYGLFGHLIEIGGTSALDLNAAALSPEASQFNPKRIAGGELLEGAGTSAPPGAMT
jgi:hypothetical protein